MKQLYLDLIESARAARLSSYSPYSHFRVGAALLAADGSVYCGTNVENASFGLSICAERAAVCAAIAAGRREFQAIAICTDTPEPTPPCGACRQVLVEFSPRMKVLLAGSGPATEQHTLVDLLARPFADLPQTERGDQ